MATKILIYVLSSNSKKAVEPQSRVNEQCRLDTPDMENQCNWFLGVTHQIRVKPISVDANFSIIVICMYVPDNAVTGMVCTVRWNH